MKAHAIKCIGFENREESIGCVRRTALKGCSRLKRWKRIPLVMQRYLPFGEPVADHPSSFASSSKKRGIIGITAPRGGRSPENESCSLKCSINVLRHETVGKRGIVRDERSHI